MEDGQGLAALVGTKEGRNRAGVSPRRIRGRPLSCLRLTLTSSTTLAKFPCKSLIFPFVTMMALDPTNSDME